MKRFLIVILGLSSLICADFSRSSEGVITDTNTHLEWQDDYSDNGNLIKNGTWFQAINYCEALDLNGNNWRLPNINELISLVDVTIHSPAINSIFQNTFNPDFDHAYNFWSSTTHNEYDSKAWYIQFDDGEQQSQDKINPYNPTYGRNVRCVRAGQ